MHGFQILHVFLMLCFIIVVAGLRAVRGESGLGARELEGSAAWLVTWAGSTNLKLFGQLS